MHEGPTRTDQVEMLRSVERQLVTVITYAKAVEALSQSWRQNSFVRGNQFLFDTVYGALWDGIIVRLGAIWDTTPRTVSLPHLAREIKNVPNAAALRLAITRASHAARARLHTQRMKAVAHLDARINSAEFDKAFQVALADVWSDVEVVEGHLASISQNLKEPPFPFQDVKEMSLQDAEFALSLFAKGVQSGIDSLLNSHPSSSHQP